MRKRRGGTSSARQSQPHDNRHSRRRWRWCTRMLVLLAYAIGTPADGAGQATIRGNIRDSLRFALDGDEKRWSAPSVALMGTNIAVHADMRGRFVIPNLASGEYRLVVAHPFLDSLGLALPPTSVIVGEVGVVRATLGTPSTASVYRWLCGKQMPRTGLIAGHVFRADGLTPVRNATVSTEWSEFQIASGRSRRVPRRAATVTGADGSFSLCGVPDDIPSDVEIIDEDGNEVDVAVELGELRIAVRELTLPRRGDSAATVSGRVVDPLGRAVRDAQVGIHGRDGSTRTDTAGRFRIDRVPPGSRKIEALRMGMQPGVATINLRPGVTEVVELQLGGAVQSLAARRIIGRMLTGPAGFEARRRAGAGSFLSGDEMEKRSVSGISEALQRMGGLWGTLADGGRSWAFTMRSATTGQSCRPRVYVNGFLWPEWGNPFEDLESMYRARDLIGIEVYKATEAPPYLPPDIRTGCGVIVISSKR